MSDNLNTENTGAGNTDAAPVNLGSTMRRVCFTLNNYTNTEIQHIVSVSEQRGYLYCIGKEVGECGTPHLQGYLEFKSPKTFNTVKGVVGVRAHLEKARGTRAQNLAYCTKEGDHVSNFPVPVCEQVLRLYDGVEWYVWQQEIIDLLDKTPDPRKIYWITDVIGNQGKTFLTKYLVAKHRVLLADGKKQDVFHQIAKRLEDEDNQDPFQMVVLDIPRHMTDYINYGLLEQLKNGLIMSGKYEGGTFVFPSPHVIVMSNSAPDLSKFSQDRWHLINLE